MEFFLKTRAWFILGIGCLLFLPAAPSLSAVIVYDQVTTVGKPVYLEVLTKGLIFAEGGRLVEFYLDNKNIGKNLTGGDGHGYRKYTPARTGMMKISARSEGETGSGLLLAMQKSEKAVLIELEGAFRDAFISKIAAGASRRAVDKLLKKYRVIYLARYIGIQKSKAWLNEAEFPDAPVLLWRGSQTLDSLEARGIRLYALVGSAGIIDEAAEHIERCYSFEQTRNGQTVTDWEQLIEMLQKSAPQKSTKSKGKYEPPQ